MIWCNTTFWDVMEQFGYPIDFIKLIKVLYDDAKMSILNGF